MESVECGAASLAMILAAYGRWVSLEEMRVACGVSRDGVTAANIVNAGRAYGLKMQGMRMGMDYLRKTPCPCILFVDGNHFVVLQGFVGNKAVVNDPARGRVLMRMNDLEARFTGIVLTAEPAENFKTGGVKTTSKGYIKQRLKGAGKAMTLTVITATLLAGVAIAMPYASQIFADDILTHKHPDWGTPLIIALAALSVFQLLVNLVDAFGENLLNGRIKTRASSDFVQHLLHLPMQFFSMRLQGDLVMRISQAGDIPTLLVQKIAPVAVNVLTLAIYGVFMFCYSWTLSLIVLASLLLIAGSINVISMMQMNIVRRSERDLSQLQSVTMSSINSIESIKAAGAEDGFFKRWQMANDRSIAAMTASDKIGIFGGVIPSILIQIASAAVLVLGCRLIMHGSMTMGMLLAFQGFSTSIFSPLTSIVDAVISLSRMRSQMERVDDVYRSEKEEYTYDDDYKPGSKLQGEIELRNVTFGYNTLHEPLIDGFSCHLRPGESIAFVGKSGSGKSTLANLISGLYQPWSGEVLFDGKPMAEVDHRKFTSSIGVVTQTQAFFSGTIRENLKLWDSTIPDDVMMDACRTAQVHDEIACRPDGYDSHMESGGRNFSGGQCQRMEIAAALAKQPRVLVLDEATSALDAETEAYVMESIKRLGITLIIIAHRLSTVRDCSEIVVLNSGKIVERGTHQQLMDKKGEYYNLNK